MKKVGIIMGSDSDLPIIKKATTMLESLNIPYEVHIYSAHRTPVEARDFALNARNNGFGAIIAAAGMAAHLAGAIAANTTIPVIGIPCKSTNLDGLDALLSTVMMPTGIPVATVAIDGGANAALLAAQIIAVEDKVIPAVNELIATFVRLEKENEGIVKSGRTHLQDAVPVSFSQEISGWRNMLEKAKGMLELSLEGLKELALGGTAVGTGLNAPKGFAEAVAEEVSTLAKKLDDKRKADAEIVLQKDKDVINKL